MKQILKGKVQRIFFFQDQYKCQWNKSWEVGFKAEDFYEK